VTIKMNNLVGSILQNTFYACCYILLSGTRPKCRCTPICGQAMLLLVQLVPKPRCYSLHTALNSPHPIHAADWHYTRNSSCITLLWLHHNQKLFISHHKDGLVNSHQSVGRWFIFFNLICSKNSFTKLVGYQQCVCQDGIRSWNHFAFMQNFFKVF